MENKTKSYSIVAWTCNGQVRMVPSLVNEMKVPYEEKISRLESLEYDDEEDKLFAISRAWEEYAEFYLNLGYCRRAYHCYENAALALSPSSETLWVQEMNSERPILSLYKRFLSMHGHCRQLISQYPALRCEYEGSRLERNYLYYTEDERREWSEMCESYENLKAWHFK